MDKMRLQFDFTKERVERLDVLKEKMNASTRAETVRRSLQFFEWAVLEAEKGKPITMSPDAFIAFCGININKKGG